MAQGATGATGAGTATGARAGAGGAGAVGGGTVGGGVGAGDVGAGAARRGRPRSAGVDEALQGAALALVAERGYGGVTMAGIAARAGVAKTTLYRRWESVEQVLIAALLAAESEAPVPDTGRTAVDLVYLLKQAVVVYRGFPGRVMPGLVSAMARDEALASALREGWLARRRQALRVVLERGAGRGELRSDADLDLAVELLTGPLFQRLLVTGGAIDDEMAEGVVDVVLRGVAAA